MANNCPECETLEDIISKDAPPTCTIQTQKRVVVLEPCGVGWKASSNGRASLGCTPGEAVDMLFAINT